ncbi:MAG: RluA family pseudouridine synthase [Candidatus Dojkabacteria bacterium]|nr:RluA family pseudouridine synthase [Candidatus Dojkabacteria bacterium]
MRFEVSIDDIDVGKRLDLYLSIKIPYLTRKYIKSIIESNRVRVNEHICYKAGYKVCPGDVIEFPDIKPVTKKIEHNNKFDLDIIYENDDFLVINKPVGVSVHPTSNVQNDTIVNRLVTLYRDLPGDMLRPGIVHRLDKATSGLLIVAKNPKSLWWLTRQFAERKIKKKYLSIGISKVRIYDKNQVIEHSSYIYRHPADRKLFVSSKDAKSQGKYAKSIFTLLDFRILNGYYLYLFDVQILTGRTHQIRVHQKDLNVPVLGDDVYMFRKLKDEIRSFDILTPGRLCLHAYLIEFINYDGNFYNFRAPIPDVFLRYFDNICV